MTRTTDARTARPRLPTLLAAPLLLAAALLAACEGDTTQIVAPEPDPPLGPDDELPGVVVAITSVATGKTGYMAPGDEGSLAIVRAWKARPGQA